MLTRQQVLKAGAAAGAALGLPWGFRWAYPFAQSPTNIRKFVVNLTGLGPSGANQIGQYIPLAAKITTTFAGGSTDIYKFEVAQLGEKNVMIKLLHSFALAAMLAPTPTVQNFIVDPDPTRHAGITGFFKGIKSFFKGERGSSLEKVVDYFTSTTNPSIVNANANGSEGVFLYLNDGSLTGTWTRHRIGYGKCYEHAAAFKYAGDKYPGIIASCDNRLVWFENPANSGGDPYSIWPTNVIYGNSGCHDFTLADIDGAGSSMWSAHRP